MDKERKVRHDSRIVVGLVVIAAGLLLLLGRLDLGVDINFRTYWPVLLIILGVEKILNPVHRNEAWSGIILAIVGGLFLLDNLDIITFSWGDLWPLLIIVAGIFILRGTSRFHFGHTRPGDESDGDKHSHSFFSENHQGISSDHLNVSAVFGGGDYNFSTKKFKGGNASALFGGIDIDLRQADMEEGSVTIHASALFGGVEIRVPSHWQTVVLGTPFLGAMENKTSTTQETTKKLIIKGSAVFGAVEVKN